MEYNKERQVKTKAFCQIRSWLETTKIPHTTNGYSIVIKTKQGEQLPIVISDGHTKATDGVQVLSDILNNKNIETAVSEFYKITEAGGYGSPNPLIRGEHVRGSYTKTPELVSFRHNEFRRVGNPPTSRIEQYKKVYNLAVNHFLGTNFYNTKNLGIEKEDLETYARVWTCNYIGLYEVQDPAPNENEKRLYSYIQQRLYNLLKIMSTKQKNCSSKDSDVLVEEETYEPQFDDEPQAIELRSTPELRSKFNQLPKTKRVKLLNGVMEDEFAKDDTKKAAKRKLSKILKEDE